VGSVVAKGSSQVAGRGAEALSTVATQQFAAGHWVRWYAAETAIDQVAKFGSAASQAASNLNKVSTVLSGVDVLNTNLLGL
jgi:hypothetical protein